MSNKTIAYVALLMFSVLARSIVCAQNTNLDTVLGKLVPIDFSSLQSNPYASDAGDLYVITIANASTVRRLTTAIAAGDSVRRIAIVRVGDQILVYYSADKPGDASATVEVTRPDGKVVQLISFHVDEAQQFNRVIEIDLDGAFSGNIAAYVGDIVKIKKRKANLTKIASESANSAIVRKDSLISEADHFIYYYSCVGRGTTPIVVSYATAGTDGGAILRIGVD